MREKIYLYMHLMKTEGVEVLGVRGEDVLLQPVQGDAKELKHLEGEREIEVEIHNQIIANFPKPLSHKYIDSIFRDLSNMFHLFQREVLLVKNAVDPLHHLAHLHPHLMGVIHI